MLKSYQKSKEENIGLNNLTAYFAGGCFWCITPFFYDQNGVKNVKSGFSGGDEESPKYEDVKNQKTGHRETIAVEYDPSAVSYEALLKIFLSRTDLFDSEGQFVDRGHSYTLAVYYTDLAEKAEALKLISEIEKDTGKKVFVSVEPFKSFYEAEEYHQDYFRKNPEAFEKEILESGRASCPLFAGYNWKKNV